MSLLLSFQLLGAYIEMNLDWMEAVYVGDKVYLDY